MSVLIRFFVRHSNVTFWFLAFLSEAMERLGDNSKSLRVFAHWDVSFLTRRTYRKKQHPPSIAGPATAVEELRYHALRDKSKLLAIGILSWISKKEVFTSK